MAKVVKPNKAEAKIIDKRLRKQYPQMYTDDWAKRLKGNVQKELKVRDKLAPTIRTNDTIKSLKRAGISEDEINTLMYGRKKK